MQPAPDATASGATILVVEDQLPLALVLRTLLQAEGHRVELAPTAAAALEALRRGIPDLIVLDLGLPDVDGTVLCRAIKRRPDTSDVPIVVCSARDHPFNKEAAFDFGVDDFIAKPFHHQELKARVRAVLRRTRRPRPPPTESGPEAETNVPAPTGAPAAAGQAELAVGNLRLDTARRRATLGGAPLHLTPIEYRLLAALAGRPDEVLSREELVRLVWGYEHTAGIDRSLKVHVRRLRAKLAAGPVPAPPIVAVRGFGYLLTRDSARRRHYRSPASARTTPHFPTPSLSLGRQRGPTTGGRRPLPRKQTR